MPRNSSRILSAMMWNAPIAAANGLRVAAIFSTNGPRTFPSRRTIDTIQVGHVARPFHFPRSLNFLVPTTLPWPSTNLMVIFGGFIGRVRGRSRVLAGNSFLLRRLPSNQRHHTPSDATDSTVIFGPPDLSRAILPALSFIFGRA